MSTRSPLSSPSSITVPVDASKLQSLASIFSSFAFSTFILLQLFPTKASTEKACALRLRPCARGQATETLSPASLRLCMAIQVEELQEL
ncbi:uncharacterized [Tachysurus ichikawai]